MPYLISWFYNYFNTFKDILEIEFDSTMLNVKKIKKIKERMLR